MLTERFERFFKTDDEKVREAEKIIGLLKDSPELQQRNRERDEMRVAGIRQHLADREELLQEQSQTMPRLRAAVAEAQDREKCAQEALQAASRERINAEYARLGASSDFSVRLANVESEIRKAAPPEIDDFIREMVGEDEKARHALDVQHKPGPKSWITGTHSISITHSNRAAVEKARAYIKAAIAEVEAMKLQAIAHDQAISRLGELRAGIPDTGRFESLEIPLPDVSELRRVAQ